MKALKVTATAVVIAGAFALGIWLTIHVLGLRGVQASGLWVGLCGGTIFGYWLRGRK